VHCLGQRFGEGGLSRATCSYDYEAHFVLVPTICRRRSNARMLLKQRRDAFEFGQETPGKSPSSFVLVEPNGIRKIVRGEPV
jgi:hypothetical protein